MTSSPIEPLPPTAGDLRFLRLLRWETRYLRGPRRVDWGLAIFAATTAIVGVAFWGASQPFQLEGSARGVHDWVIAWLLATPLRDPLPDMGQITFGYSLLRLASFALIAIAHVLIPVLFAGSVSDDRRSGRLESLQLTLITASELTLAKVAGAALPFLAVSLALPIVFSGILVSESVPILEVLRLEVEAAGQALLAAAVTVACSALFAPRWSGTFAASFLLWLVFPAGWRAALAWMGAVNPLPNLLLRRPEEYAFGAVCAAQAAATAAGILLAFSAGTRRLRRLGFGGRPPADRVRAVSAPAAEGG